MELTVHDITQAAGGQILTGNPETVIERITIDSRDVTGQSLFVPLAGSRHDGHDFIAAALRDGAAAALLQKNRAVPDVRDGRHAIIRVNDPLTALGDIAHCWRKKCGARVAAITGSNGKTTTKEMAWGIINRVLSAIRNPGNWNNLIGLPLSLLQLRPEHDMAILEMGMSARGEISRLCSISEPQIGLITNVGPAHLEQLHDLDNVLAAKAELFRHLGPGDTAVINTDDSRIAPLADSLRVRTVSFGMGQADVRARHIRLGSASETVFDLELQGRTCTIRLPLMGLHFVSNALAAAALAHAAGVGLEDIRAGLEAVKTVPGRMETIRTGGVVFINDAYNANPVSMEASLQALQALQCTGRRIAVLGDMLELGPRSAAFHHELGQKAAELNIDRLLLVGDYADDTRRGALSGGMPPEAILRCTTIEDTATALTQYLAPGDAVLLKGSRRLGLESVLAQMNGRSATS